MKDYAYCEKCGKHHLSLECLPTPSNPIQEGDIRGPALIPQTGWICPQCNRGMSPAMPWCNCMTPEVSR